MGERHPPPDWTLPLWSPCPDRLHHYPMQHVTARGMVSAPDGGGRVDTMAWWFTGLIAFGLLSASLGFLAGCAWNATHHAQPRPNEDPLQGELFRSSGL